jgi:hypothetical protein
VASVRTNQIAHQMSALGSRQLPAQLGRSAIALTARFRNGARSSNVTTARSL